MRDIAIVTALFYIMYFSSMFYCHATNKEFNTRYWYSACLLASVCIIVLFIINYF